MANPNRRGGIIEVAANGEVYDAKGSFTYNLGQPQRNTIVGADKVHGFSETPQAAYIEGAITDRGTLDLKALAAAEGQTVTLRLANGKQVILREAWFSGSGNGSTAEGEITVRWDGVAAEEA